MAKGFYSYADVEQLVETFVERKWMLESDDVPLFFANTPFKKPAPPYLRVSIQHGFSDQVGCGPTDSQAMVRRVGVLSINIYIAADKGKRRAAVITDKLAALLENVVLDPVEFGQVSFGPEVQEGTNLQITVQVPFTWDTWIRPLKQVAV